MPLPNRPRTAPPPATPTQTPMAFGRSSTGKEVVITDSVVGMIAAAPMPISARSAISWAGSLVSMPRPGSDAEHGEAADEQLAAPEPVTQRSGEQQEAGEHDGVGVDDPGDLGLAGAGLPGQVGQGHVEAADRRDDGHQRERDDGEDGAGAWPAGCEGG